MELRSPAERIRQTVFYEIGGICLVTPLYMVITGSNVSESLLLFVAISAAIMIWSPIHNTLFDIADLRLYKRVASDRPQKARIVHAISHEVTAVCVSLPLLIWLGGMSFWEAVLADLTLTIFYAAYAYVFHLFYDWWRPVQITPEVEGNKETS